MCKGIYLFTYENIVQKYFDTKVSKVTRCSILTGKEELFMKSYTFFVNFFTLCLYAFLVLCHSITSLVFEYIHNKAK